MICSVFAGCQIPYPKREFLNEDEPEEKGDKGIELHLGKDKCSNSYIFNCILFNYVFTLL